jgi:ATP-dependent protease ClpP protease subunit
MKQHVIVISSPIGVFQYKGKEIKGVTLLDIVTAVGVAPKGTEIIRVQIASSGGRVDVGNQIYNYLNALKGQYKIITEQIGYVASIATKIFGVGDEREGLEGENFMFHNPWTQVVGDAAHLAEASAQLKIEEDELKNFYMALTGVNEEGIKPLMDAETEFSAEQAVQMGFATKLNKALKIAAFMNKKTKTKVTGLLSQLLAYFTDSSKAMTLELEGGTQLMIEAEDDSKLEGAPAFTIVEENGETSQVSAADGDYKLTDGRTVTVAEGKVVKVTAAPAAKKDDEEKEEDVALAAVIKNLTNVIAGQKNSKAEIMAAIDAKFVELRNEIKTKHVPKGFKPETSADDAKEWDRAFKANEIKALKTNDPEKYQRIFYAKYGKMPNM